jgi:hypothetical protein
MPINFIKGNLTQQEKTGVTFFQTDILTDSNQGVDNIWDGSKANTLLVGSKVSRKVCGEPLHDDVVGPVHGKMCYIQSPQRPVAHKLCPPYIWICYLEICRISISSPVCLKTYITFIQCVLFDKYFTSVHNLYI